MAIKSDRWIRRMAQEHGMINPFNGRQVCEGVISLSSSGKAVTPEISNSTPLPAKIYSDESPVPDPFLPRRRA